MNKWQDSGNYMGYDLSHYYILISKTRDSEMEELSNYESILSDMRLNFTNKECEAEEEKGWCIASFGHWACGWVESIMIHESEEEIIEFGNEVQHDIQENGLYNEDDYYEREMEYRNENFVILAWNSDDSTTDRANYKVILEELKERFPDDRIEEYDFLKQDGWFDTSDEIYCHKDMTEIIEEVKENIANNGGFYNDKAKELVGEMLTLPLFTYSYYDNKNGLLS